MAQQNELAAIVGKEWVRAGRDVQTFAIDDVCPSWLVYPGSVDELAAIMRCARQREWIVVPAGFGAGLGLGNRLSRVDIVVSTQRLNQILEYTPEDLTAAVQAGCSLASFNAVLQEHGQWLPLDPPQPERASLGAIAATADFGPLRLGFGLPRDYVIGMQVVQPDGTVIKSGGRVVKNVAGYDLNKLFVGSLGTLGIIAQLNLKLRPLPPADATCSVQADTLEALDDLIRLVAASELLPAALVSCSADTAEHVWPDCSHSGWLCLIRFLDAEAAVAYQLTRLHELARTSAVRCEQLEASRAHMIWQRIRDLRAAPAANLVLRLHVRPSDVSRLFSLVGNCLAEGCDQVLLCSYNRVGAMIACARSEPTVAIQSNLCDRLHQLRRQCQMMDGSMIIERAPTNIKQAIDVWGEVGSSIGLMRSLKQQFDPKRILNPGRFVGGI
ncbi:MAG: FAD-binding oxidoreductase [Acidobacteriota bacterium]|nr:FAD-binding oxidoreductase [Blastocatellia bacterium]MDW8240355.1 FAD-binding oxidoreductase [Acidobacteriota bacterium]